jgi:hypothetical protein
MDQSPDSIVFMVTAMAVYLLRAMKFKMAAKLRQIKQRCSVQFLSYEDLTNFIKIPVF